MKEGVTFLNQQIAIDMTEGTSTLRTLDKQLG